MNYYEILEVSQNASPEVIKAAYKSLIQRYHPDRNPGNAEIAERASLVVQAYDLLSDVEKRAVYDLQLKQQPTAPINNMQDSGLDTYAPGANARRQVVKASKSYWYLWLLIVLIIFLSWIILSLTKVRQSPESELKELRLSIAGKQLAHAQLQDKLKRMDEIFKEHPEILRKEASAKADEEAARTITIFLTELYVHLKIPENSSGDKGKTAEDSAKIAAEPGKPLANSDKFPGEPSLIFPGDAGAASVDSGYALSVPVIGVRVGTFDSVKVMRHLESKRELIRQKLVEKLAYAKYEELIKIDAEEYLKKIILDSIGDTTGTDRFESYPSSDMESPGRYGVVDVFFPEDFAAR